MPRLLDAGYNVRVLVRHLDRLAGFAWATRVEVAVGDVTEAVAMRAATAGIDVLYYLVHSLSEQGFAAVEFYTQTKTAYSWA